MASSATDISAKANAIHSERVPENFLDLFTHERIQGSGRGHDRLLRRNPNAVTFREQSHFVN